MNRQPLYRLLTLCLAAFVGQSARAEQGPARNQPDLAAKIDAIVRGGGVGPKQPGVAVLVLKGGRVVFERCYGLANLQQQTPIAPHTTFELASVSKTFTATAVLILHERGKLALGDDVRKFIPELPAYFPQHPIRVMDLLHHTSGLPDYLAFKDVKPSNGKYLTNADHAAAFAPRRKTQPPHFAPGARYEYSNSGYMLLALIVERVSGKSFGAFLRQEIFRPLGMSNSWVHETPQSVPRHPRFGYVHALGYSRTKQGGYRVSWGAPPFRPERLLTTGDGAVWSSLEDMARWDAGLRAGKLLRPQTRRLALTPSKTRNGKRNDYGLGWDLEFNARGQLTVYGHDGDWEGFLTFFHRDLGSDHTVILLSNRGDYKIDRVGEQLLKLLRGR
jgi:CubicO group peptidase (beta-lactamase class C family)